MAFQGDPYRILGLAPGASLNEIRSAYRRLAKQYHPDAAGERALDRFLAIQAAYERLVDGDGRLRSATQGGVARTAGRAREPWRADPTRARASRDAWRARRAGQASGTWSTARDRTEPAGRRGTGTGARSDWPPHDGAGERNGGHPDERSGRRADGARDERSGQRDREQTGGRATHRGPRKATPGSTTYDDAADGIRDPEWDGGSWYGTSSRTYWTINPREYADPRKHGPEYQARARRAASWAPAGSSTAGPSATPGTTEGSTGRDGWGSGSWTYRSDPEPGSADTARRRADRDPPRSPPPRWTGPSPASPGVGEATGDPDLAPLPDLESLARLAAPRHLLELARRPDRRWRLMLALIGWPPVGWAVGTLLTTTTGCASFAASCPAPVPTLSVLVQPLIVAALFLVPPAAALAAFASIAALAAAVPLAAVLAVGAGRDTRAGAPVLGVLVAATYLVSLAGGGLALWRPPREP